MDLIEIDASSTSTIHIERQLTIIEGDPITHACADFTSVNGRVVLDATTTPGVVDVLPSRTNHFHLRNFIVRGGRYTGGATDLRLYHSRLVGGTGAGSFALQVRPANGRAHATLGECILRGAVTIRSGNTGNTLLIHNSQIENGPCLLGSGGASPDLVWTRFDNAPVTLDPVNAKPATFNQCEFHSSPIANAGTGSCTLSGSFRSVSPTSGAVTEVNPAPAAWLGRASVTPNNPAIGTTFYLDIILPAGSAAVWWIGFPSIPPVALPPHRFYLNTLAFATVLGGVGPGLVSVPLNVPGRPRFSGKELYAQPITFSTTAAPHVPINLPRGDLIRIQ